MDLVFGIADRLAVSPRLQASSTPVITTALGNPKFRRAFAAALLRSDTSKLAPRVGDVGSRWHGTTGGIAVVDVSAALAGGAVDRYRGHGVWPAGYTQGRCIYMHTVIPTSPSLVAPRPAQASLIFLQWSGLLIASLDLESGAKAIAKVVEFQVSGDRR